MVQHDVDGYSRRGIEFQLTRLQNRDEPSDAPKSPVGREFKSEFFGGDMGDRGRSSKGRLYDLCEAQVTTERKNSLLAFGALVAFSAFACTWMTIYIDTVSDSPSDVLSDFAFPGIGLPLSPFNGTVSLLVKIPVWAVILLAALSNIIQLVAQTKSFDVPKVAMWILAAISAAYVAVPFLLGLIAGQVSPGAGLVLGAFSVAIAIYCLLPSPNANEGHNN